MTRTVRGVGEEWVVKGVAAKKKTIEIAEDERKKREHLCDSGMNEGNDDRTLT